MFYIISMQNSVLMGILYSLLSGKKLKAKDLANNFEISQRTVYRYIDTLCASGVPIISSRGLDGGFYVENKSRINNIFLTRSEIEYLINNVKNQKDKSLDEQIVLAKLYSFYCQFTNQSFWWVFEIIFLFLCNHF